MSGYLALADGRTVAVRNGLVIGRVAGCDLVIDDHKASRRHARIVVESGVVEIEDLESSNGTLLNGKPVTRRVLRPGDEVQIGKMVIVYRDGIAAGGSGSAGGGAGAAAAAAAASAPVFADDDDLLGSAPAATAAPAAPAAPAPKPVAPPPPPPRPVPEKAAPRPVPPAPTVAPVPPPPAPTPRPAVVEFADEIVEVKKATVPPAGAKAPVGAATEPMIRTQRVLQYSKQAGGGGVLADDLGQMSSGTRSLIFAAVLAAAGGIAWLVMRVVG